MARPSPFRRPELRRISDTEIWPRITARIESGNAKMKRPETRLAIALPLVCAGNTVPSAAGPKVDGAAALCDTSFPQTLQNLSPTGASLPQTAQNMDHNLTTCVGERLRKAYPYPPVGSISTMLQLTSEASLQLDDPQSSRPWSQLPRRVSNVLAGVDSKLTIRTDV
jgi:hypothetical protein